MSDPNYGTKKTPEGHTARLKKAKTLDVLVGSEVLKFPCLDVSKGVVEVFMHSAHEGGENEGYCRMVFFKGSPVRLLECTNKADGSVTVAGYWKGYFFPGKEEYELGLTDNRWETIQLIPQKERTSLERFLKKTHSYSKITFW